MDIVVVGCGVMGLSCGILLQEAGHNVVILARDLPPDTTSNVAAALWYPYKAYPETLVFGWGAVAYQEFAALAEHAPESGVVMREGREMFPTPVDDPWWRDAVPSFRRAEAHELTTGYVDGYVFAAPIIDMSVYLAYLFQRFAAAGGLVEQQYVPDIETALHRAPLVINCAGLGARELVGDHSVFPIRGQIVRVSLPADTRFVLDDYGPNGVTYIIPRLHDCVLGGTADDGVSSLEPDPATAASIISRCAVHNSQLASSTVLGHRVGLRPGRPTVRLEAEQRPGGLVIHNYGHGGAGVTLSWGCAAQVAALVAEAS